MIGPDDMDAMRPESPMPRPERSAEWLAGWRAGVEAAARLAQSHDKSIMSMTELDAQAIVIAVAIRAMRPEDQP